MDRNRLIQILEAVSLGQTTPQDALTQLRAFPFEDLGFAKIDTHRSVRNHIPEVIYCEGKTIDQVKKIVQALVRHHSNVLATRASQETFEGVLEIAPNSHYHAIARLIVANPQPVEQKGNIAVICAGTSDIPVAEEAALTAEILGNRVNRFYDIGVAGIHRLFDVCEQLWQANVAVVVAGMEGALASVIGGIVSCPVIGVPTSIGYGASLNGIAALLTMLNSCAVGVSVVNIDNGFGAGCQANMINQLAVPNK